MGIKNSQFSRKNIQLFVFLSMFKIEKTIRNLSSKKLNIKIYKD